MTEKIKRLLILSADRFPPFRADVKDLFGIELCKKKYRIDWILQSESEIPEPEIIEWHCGKVWAGKTNNGTAWYQRLHKHLLRISSELQLFRMNLEQYDVIQVKDRFITALFVIMANRKNNTRFVYWLSYPFPESSLYEAKTHTARYPLFYWVRGHVLKFLLYKIILPKADHIFAQSDQMKIDLQKEGVSKHRITPVPMGISDTNLPAVTEIPAKADSEKMIVLYLGTLEKVRRMDFVVRVYSLVKNMMPNTILYLVGDGKSPADVDAIRNEVDTCGLDQSDVVITGFIPMKEAWEYVKKADVCLSPFYPTPILNSTSPTKLIEYMSLSRPVVANEHPEQEKVIRESGAGICVPYDENEFADAVIQILKDKNKALEMGAKGRAYVEKHRTYSKIAELVDAKYEDIISDAVPTGSQQRGSAGQA